MDRARGDELTWVGHSTVIADLAGTRLVTDPVLTPRVAHLRRHVTPADDDRAVGGVLISHVHLDHLHLPSLRRFDRETPVVVPRGAARLLHRARFTNVRETHVGDVVRLGAIDVATVPARHSDRRGPHSRVSAAAVGYVLRANGRSVYFAGDTDLFPAMAELAPVDVALLPIWGWGPTLGPGHLDPARAAQATALLDADVVVPIHWGTYSPSVVRRRPPQWLAEPVERFGTELEALDLAHRARVLQPGGRLRFTTTGPAVVS
jgi:L-ascorbate metabolism protein UlaG (beta-lactamase superfamily)